MLRVLDLFSGLGGASEAFVDRGHQVERFDFDARFSEVPYTTIKDVKLLMNRDLEGYDIALAGVPCQCFSQLCNHITWPKGEPRELIREMISFVREVKEWLERSKARYYIIENPMGMMRRPEVLGRPDAHVCWAAYHNDPEKPKKPTDLWGRLPPFDRYLPFKWVKAPRGSNSGIQKTGLSAEERSLWPYEFSLAVCLAVEGNSAQTTLYDHCVSMPAQTDKVCKKEVN